MIIFNLDDCLADCQHRMHFVDPEKRNDTVCWMMNTTKEYWCYREGVHNFETRKKFEPDYKSFYDACDKDKPILPVWGCFHRSVQWHDVEIWSGRCDSVREKTINWIMNKAPLKTIYWNEESWNSILKMRPIGDKTPDEQLKEQWLDDHIAHEREPIEIAFDSDPESIKMWVRRGIFVFDCKQQGKDF